VRHHRRSASSTARNASNTPTAANRRAIAADSARAASPITSINRPGSTPSNMCSTLQTVSDTVSQPEHNAQKVQIAS
jgi:hypothetical protein